MMEIKRSQYLIHAEKKIEYRFFKNNRRVFVYHKDEPND